MGSETRRDDIEQETDSVDDPEDLVAVRISWYDEFGSDVEPRESTYMQIPDDLSEEHHALEGDEVGTLYEHAKEVLAHKLKPDN